MTEGEAGGSGPDGVAVPPQAKRAESGEEC
jgi:hypothetical protein